MWKDSPPRWLDVQMFLPNEKMTTARNAENFGYLTNFILESHFWNFTDALLHKCELQEFLLAAFFKNMTLLKGPYSSWLSENITLGL